MLCVVGEQGTWHRACHLGQLPCTACNIQSRPQFASSFLHAPRSQEARRDQRNKSLFCSHSWDIHWVTCPSLPQDEWAAIQVMSEILLQIHKSVSGTPSGGTFNLKKSDECRTTINQQQQQKGGREGCAFTQALTFYQHKHQCWEIQSAWGNCLALKPRH